MIGLKQKKEGGVVHSCVGCKRGETLEEGSGFEKNKVALTLNIGGLLQERGRVGYMSKRNEV